MKYEPSSYWVELSNKCDEMLSYTGYKNFKRSVGIVYNDYFYDYEKGDLLPDYADRVKEIWDRMYQVYPHDFLDQFNEPTEGNPLAIEYKGRLVSIDLAASISEYALISKLIPCDDIKTIHEIGGGYGRLAYLIHQIHPDIKYRFYDIEPSLSLAKRYLNSVLSDNKIEFMKPDQMIDNCDLLLAMDCLHEMTKECVSNYFSYADTHARYFYYTCWKETVVKDHGIEWKQSDYPVRPSWQQLHLAQHRMRTQFFEAVYKI